MSILGTPAAVPGSKCVLASMAVRLGSSIRNSWTRAVVRRLRALPADRREPILARIDPETLKTVRRTRDAGFIPLETAVEVVEALRSGFDDDALAAFWAELVTDSYAGGLFTELIVKAATGFGGDGTGLLKLAPAAWNLSSRNAGEVKVVRGASGSLTLSGEFPPSIHDSHGFRLVFRGALTAMLGLTKIEAELVEEHDDGTLRFHVVPEGAMTRSSA